MSGPAPRDRRYIGSRQPRQAGPGAVSIMDMIAPEIATSRTLDPRFDLRNHSPDGFQWGYGGSGPAQLALAICADATGDDELAQRVYQAFKFAIVARMGDRWELKAGEVADLCHEIDKDRTVAGVVAIGMQR